MLTERELKTIVTDVLAGLGYGVAAAERPMASSGPAAQPPPASARPGRSWQNPEAMEEMLAATPARIDIGRAGARYDTAAWLKFRIDHGAARDAIFHEVSPEFLTELGAVVLETQVTDRREYLVRPDLGRRLTPESERLLRERGRPGALIQLVVVDGLSGTAIEANAMDFIQAFRDGLKLEGMDPSALSEPLFVRMGRVAVMDQIGEVLRPDLIVELVGERPGLVSAESMSAYFCYRPCLTTIESDRTLISNIHRGGIPSVEAGAHAARLARRILEAKVSGVKLGL